MGEIEELMTIMLNKLVGKRKIGGSHTEIRNLTKGLPEHLRNRKGRKTIQEAIKELVRRGYIKVKPSTGEIHVSINPEKIKEVFEFLDKNK